MSNEVDIHSDSHTLKLVERWLRILLLLMGTGVFIFLFFQLKHILLPFVISVILAYVLNPVVRALEARAIRRSAAVTFLTSMMLLAVVGVGWFGIPALAGEIETIQRKLPQVTKDLKVFAVELENSLEENYPMIGSQPVIAPAFEQLEAKSSQVAGEIPKWIMENMEQIVLLILVPFNVFFFLRDGDGWMQKIYNILPNRYVETVLSVVSEINASLGGYIRGLLLDGAIVGTMIAIGLYFLSVDYWLLIGLITGVGNIIPYFGPVVGCILAVVVAVLGTGGPAVILKILILFGAVKFLDDFFFQVLIVGASAHVHAVLVVLSVFMGGYLLGIVGMVIAVPITVSVQVMIRILIDRYRFHTTVAAKERALGDHWVC